MYIDNHPSNFTQREIAAAIQIWNRAAVSLLDIRHSLITPEQSVRSYHLPASAFVFTSGGKAEVMLDETAYNVDRFGLFHGGKGTELTITPRCDWLETYTVLYKAGEPPFQRRDYGKLLEKTNPFCQQYGFAPENPLLFADQLRSMFECWKGATDLNLFYGKAAFYQLVHQVYTELAQERIPIFEPDTIATAKRYLDKCYAQPVAIQELCGTLGISYSHFHRSFKRETGKSPQEYLISARLDAATLLLTNSDASLREIAIRCGFADEQGLYRMFVKKNGVSPSVYRENMYDCMRDGALQNCIAFPYNEQGRVNLDKLQGRGATSMFKQMKSKAVVAAALSLMLLMAACSTAPITTGTAEPTSTPAVTSQVTEQPKESQPSVEGTRTISMEYGDVEIPADPKRVVVAIVQGDLLALGIMPVGTSFNSGAAFESQAQGATVIDAFTINEEEILALYPDLIIWNSYNEQTYQSLSKIAPTLAQDFFNMEYRERLRFFGEIFNRADKAEELISDFEQKLASAKTQLEEAGLMDKNFICVDVRDGFLRAFEGGRGGGLVYEFLGFPAPEKLQAVFETEEFQAKTNVDLSFEVLPEYVGDFVLLNTSADKLIDNAVWENLPAVKEGRVIKASTDMFWFNDILSLSKQLDIILEGVLGSQN